MQSANSLLVAAVIAIAFEEAVVEVEEVHNKE